VRDEKTKMGVSDVPSINKDIKSVKCNSLKSNNFKSLPRTEKSAENGRTVLHKHSLNKSNKRPMQTGFTPRSTNTAPTRQNAYMNKLVKERSITPNKRKASKPEITHDEAPVSLPEPPSMVQQEDITTILQESSAALAPAMPTIEQQQNDLTF